MFKYLFVIYLTSHNPEQWHKKTEKKSQEMPKLAVQLKLI